MSTAGLWNTRPSSPTVDLREGAGLPLTALSLVEAAGANIGQQLATVAPLNEASALVSRSSSSLRAGADDELAELAREFLNVDLGSVLLAGVQTIDELVRAARRTSGTHDSEVVDLVGHQVQLALRPSVDVVLMNSVVASVPFTVQVDLTITALAGTVRDGLLVSLTSGAVDAVVTFGACGTELAAARRTFDPRIHVGLGNGVRIPFAG